MKTENTTSSEINKDKYLEDLKKRQEEHLRKVNQRRNDVWQPCMHDKCPQCHGTGIKLNGATCIHAMSCGCPKCSARF